MKSHARTKAKTLLALVVFGGLLLSIAACGDNGGSGGQGPVPPTTTYYLSTHVDGSGAISPNGGTYSAGTSVTLSATANQGWRFDHWSGGVSGTSSTVTVSINSDKNVTGHFVKVNPPIRVVLNKVQAIEDCEPFIRPPGEFYFAVVVTDGNTSSELIVPSTGNYPLYDGDTVTVNKVCFSTSQVGDYLQLVVVGFEQDSGICYGQYVFGAAILLGDSIVPGMSGAASTLLSIIEEQRGGEGFWCDMDDFAGSYEHTWYENQNWGVGSHSVSAPPYLKLWLTIEEG